MQRCQAASHSSVKQQQQLSLQVVVIDTGVINDDEGRKAADVVNSVDVANAVETNDAEGSKDVDVVNPMEREDDDCRHSARSAPLLGDPSSSVKCKHGDEKSAVLH